MYLVEKSFRFEAGHQLMHHDGECGTPHGHSYVLTVKIASEKVILEGPKREMVIDFKDIASIVKPMVDTYLDHCWLNTTLNTDSPSVEFIAKWIFDYLKPKLPELSAITVQETATSSVTYTR